MAKHTLKEPPSSCLTESDAIVLAQNGDPAAFERIYQLHSRRVYALCLRMVTNPVEAQDLTQDAFLQVFRKIGTFRGDSGFSTWLHRLTVNIVLMRFRKMKRAELPLEDAQTSEENLRLPLDPGADDLCLNGLIDRVNLQRAVEQLPYGYRQMFVLHDVQGYEHNEIAEILGCSVGNSKSQLHKARLRLRQLLREDARNQAREKREAESRKALQTVSATGELSTAKQLSVRPAVKPARAARIAGRGFGFNYAKA